MENSYASSFLSFDNTYGWEVFAILGIFFAVIVAFTLYIFTTKAASYNKPGQ
jgi:nitrogen fixation protein FixH